ncbi:alpha/beta hydrolase [Paenibacillus sp. TRM 82003]|nr:alpha/beta hydrolase [Paenibacillus sp. TRM 82003]
METHTIYKSERGRTNIREAYEAYLQTFDAEFERVFVDTRFGKTHVLATGPRNGPPLIVLQGGNCINPMTLSWFTGLLASYRVYAPDTVGHPGFSAETRMSAKNDDFASWIGDLMDGLRLERCAFVGPSYGAGMILRTASVMPERIACAALVAPSGLALGSKPAMIRRVLLPMLGYVATSSPKALRRVADALSAGTMSARDEAIVGDIFKLTKLEQEMPKLAKKENLLQYNAPTLVVTGRRDIFFPASKVEERARAVIPNLVDVLTYDMGHFPSETLLPDINAEIAAFLRTHYG